MAATSTHGNRPPLQGIHRSHTTPARSMTPREQAGLDASDANAQVLYEHPAARVISFSPSTDSIKSSDRSGLPHDTDYPVDTIETLAWRSRGEALEGAGHLIIEKVRGSTYFLKCQNAMHAIMRNSQCWCVDGESKFVLRKAAFRYYRIELPSASDADKAKVEEFKQVLTQVLRYENSPCPFKRAFTVDLPDDAITPRRKGTWKRRDSSQPPTPDTESPKTNDILSAKRRALRSPPTAYPKNAPGYAASGSGSGSGLASRPGSSAGAGRKSSIGVLESNTDGQSEKDDGTRFSEAGSDDEKESDNSRVPHGTGAMVRGRPGMPRRLSSSTPVSQRVASIEKSGSHSAILPASDGRKRLVSVEARRVWEDRPLWHESDYSEQAPGQTQDAQLVETSPQYSPNDTLSNSQADAAPSTAREVAALGEKTTSLDAAPVVDIDLHIDGRYFDGDTSAEEDGHSNTQLSVSSESTHSNHQVEDNKSDVVIESEVRESTTKADVAGMVAASEEVQSIHNLITETIGSDSAHEDNLAPSEPLANSQIALSTSDELPASAELKTSRPAEETVLSGLELSEDSYETSTAPPNTAEHERSVAYHFETLNAADNDRQSSLQYTDDSLATPIATIRYQELPESEYLSEVPHLSRDMQQTDEEFEQDDNVSVVSDADSFHTLASTLARSHSDDDPDQARTPTALEFDLLARPSMSHHREISEMTVTSSQPDDISTNTSATASGPPGLNPSGLSNQTLSSHAVGLNPVSHQEFDGSLRQRLRSRRSFSPMPPPSTIITNTNTQENQARRITKIILQQAIVKPVEIAVLLVHILSRIASGATVNDLLSGDLFRRPEHRRRVSGFADQVNHINRNEEHEDDYGVPIHGRRTREHDVSEVRGRPVNNIDEDAQSFVSVD